MDEHKDKVQALVDLIAKQPLGVTSNGTFGLMCTKPVEYNAGSGHVVKAWDGKTRLSPAEEYLKQARGGLDAVRGDSFHFVAAASLRDGIQLEVEGYVVGKIIGPIFKYGAELLPAAKEAAKAAFKSASEAAKQAGKSASEALSMASKAAGEAAAKVMNAAKKAVNNGVAVSARPKGIPPGKEYASKDPTFRGDSRKPSEIFDNGFSSRGDNVDLARYQSLENPPSRYIGTSTSEGVATGFANSSGTGGYVYKVDPQGLYAVDVNATLGSRSLLPHELEVVIIDKIPTQNIISARQVMPDGSLGPIIRNPSYKPPSGS
jgi:Heat-labile enterotoxin alpha chain